MNKKNQQMARMDRDFIKILEKIKAKRILAEKPVSNIGDLSNEMINLPEFEIIEEKLSKGILSEEVKIRLDKKRLF